MPRSVYRPSVSVCAARLVPAMRTVTAGTATPDPASVTRPVRTPWPCCETAVIAHNGRRITASASERRTLCVLMGRPVVGACSGYPMEVGITYGWASGAQLRALRTAQGRSAHLFPAPTLKGARAAGDLGSQGEPQST